MHFLTMMVTRGLGVIRRARNVALTAAISGALFAIPAVQTRAVSQANEYPSGNVRIIVPFAPGAAVDIAARMVAAGLAAQSGKTVVVENRPGAATVVGSEAVAQSEPDGHTLLFMPDDTFTILPHVSRNLRFDPNKQLTPVAGVANIINVLVAHPSVPSTFVELIDYARSHPGELRYGNSGVGSAAQIAMEMLKSRTKIDILQVPYKGNAPALMATVTGEVHMVALGYGTARQLIQDGKLRALAVAGPQREPSLPNVPTTAELGYPDFDVTTRLLISVTSKTPPAVVQQVANAIWNVLNKPEIQKQIEARGLVVANVGTKEFAEGMAQRSMLNAEAVRISGVQIN